MTQETIGRETRICRDPECRRKYEAKTAVVLNHKIVFGDGLCPGCARMQYEAELAFDKSMRQTAIDKQRRLWRNTCGIPPKFVNEDFSTFKRDRQLKVYKVCCDYAEKYPLGTLRGYRSLVLFSEHSWGVGKTHLACSIGHRILDRWNGEDTSCPVRFISEPELYTRIQATYSFSGENGQRRESEAYIIRELINVRLLIIDDVGKRRVSDPKFVQRIMFALIDGRYKAMLPIVLTANLDPDGLANYLGGGLGDEASMDRLVEMCPEFWQVEGESYRKIKAGAK